MEKPNIQKNVSDPLLFLALSSNKDLFKASIVYATICSLLRECIDNADFYTDLIRFNLGSREFKEKEYIDVAFHDLPPEIDKAILKVYVRLKDYTNAQIYKILNLYSSTTNRVSPIETKWVYHYRTIYKTKKYKPANKIDESILLTPLSDIELIEYKAMCF